MFLITFWFKFLDVRNYLAPGLSYEMPNSYMFLITFWFTFLDVRNYLAPSLSYDGWCKANGCQMQKFVFPYKWPDDHERLSQVVPVSHEAFYSELEGNITNDEYDKFVQEFSE